MTFASSWRRVSAMCQATLFLLATPKTRMVFPSSPRKLTGETPLQFPSRFWNTRAGELNAHSELAVYARGTVHKKRAGHALLQRCFHFEHIAWANHLLEFCIAE